MSVVSKHQDLRTCMYTHLWKEESSVLLGWHLGFSFATVPHVLPPPSLAPLDKSRPCWVASRACAAPSFVSRHHASAFIHALKSSLCGWSSHTYPAPPELFAVEKEASAGSVCESQLPQGPATQEGPSFTGGFGPQGHGRIGRGYLCL